MTANKLIPSENLEVTSMENVHLLRARILGSGYIEGNFEGFEFLGLTMTQELKICVDKEVKGTDRSAVIYNEVPSVARAPLRAVGVSPRVRTLVGVKVPVESLWTLAGNRLELRRKIASYYGIASPPM